MLEDGSLHIHSAHVTDTGRYVCMATNTAGTERKRIDLQVLGKSFGFRQVYVPEARLHHCSCSANHILSLTPL